MNNDIVVIADTQVDNESPIDHIYALSRYLWKHKPSSVVHIGDHWDLPSLSSYASPLESEGRRLIDDLEGGRRAFKAITGHIKERNNKGRRAHYNPNKHFLMGNHENRLFRYIDNNPILMGMFNLESFIASEGWTINRMCDPLWINDIAFNHYMENPMSGRPIGGSIENKLNKIPHSFIHGHQQQFQYGRRQNLLGRPHFGACAGSFYLHNEGYRGANNTEIRGFLHLKSFTNRYGFLDYDVEFISLERLLEDY